MLVNVLLVLYQVFLVGVITAATLTACKPVPPPNDPAPPLVLGSGVPDDRLPPVQTKGDGGL